MSWTNGLDTVYWNSATDMECKIPKEPLSNFPTPIYRMTEDMKGRKTTEEEKNNTAEDEEKDTTGREVIEDFVNRSTLHGLQNVYNSRSRIHRFIWILLMLGATVYVLIIISQSFIKFGRYPVNTKTTMVFAESSAFPAVTICNFNRYRQGPMQGSPAADIFYAMSSAYFGENPNISWDKYNFTGMNMTQSEDHVAHNLKSMLFGCTWKGHSCSYKNFSSLITSMGKCYTFNSGKPGHPLQSVDSAGEIHGLQLMLYTEQYEYSPLTDSAGFKVILHDQKQPPVVRNFGISVPPGYRTSISVQKNEVINMEKPYENGCEKGLTLKNYGTYTKAGCMLECLEEYVIEECGCRPVEFLTEVRYCDPKELLLCSQPTEAKFSTVYAERCTCPEPCTSVHFEVSASASFYPTQVMMRQLVRTYSFMFPPNTPDTQIEKEFRENLVSLTIFYQQLSYQKIENEPAYTSLDLFGDLGGQIGLFLGCSMLTLMEFVDLFVYLLTWRWKRKSQSTKVLAVK